MRVHRSAPKGHVRRHTWAIAGIGCRDRHSVGSSGARTRVPHGFPYSQLNELQRYVGMPNCSRFPDFFSLDARVWRDFKVTSKGSIRLSVSSFNLTNHFNIVTSRAASPDETSADLGGRSHR
jgi:hypothetical protein